MATAEDRRETDSGIEIETVYTADDVGDLDLELPGEAPFTRGPYKDMYRGRAWTIRQYAGFASAEETNARFRYLLERGQTGLSVAFDLPTQLGYDSDDERAAGEVGRTGVAAAPAVRARRGEPGRLRHCAERHRPERHPQGVLRTRELHLPAAAVDADHDRSLRVLPRAAAEVEHDLDLRVPHSGGRLDGGSGARLHTGERDRLRAGRRRRGPVAGRVRRPALVLLQRAQPLLPGSGEVPRGAAPLGADHGRAVRRDEPEGAGAPLPCPDRRFDVDRAAAREQRRARGRPGALRGVRRRSVDPHERVRRGAGAADRAFGQDRAPYPAGPRSRGRWNGHGRPARRRVLHRDADARARGAGVGADRPGR